MLGQTRRGRAARLAAVLVAVALTGSPRVLAIHAPVEAHPCSCKSHPGGQRSCACAICRKAALSAQASDESQPACHRAAARKALSNTGTRGSPQVPCLEGTCGGTGRPVMTLAGVEPFFLPAQKLVTPALAPEARPFFTERLRERSLEPETPPPRAA